MTTTSDDIIHDLEEIFAQAKDEGNLTAALKAKDIIGKLTRPNNGDHQTVYKMLLQLSLQECRELYYQLRKEFKNAKNPIPHPDYYLNRSRRYNQQQK